MESRSWGRPCAWSSPLEDDLSPEYLSILSLFSEDIKSLVCSSSRMSEASCPTLAICGKWALSADSLFSPRTCNCSIFVICWPPKKLRGHCLSLAWTRYLRASYSLSNFSRANWIFCPPTFSSEALFSGWVAPGEDEQTCAWNLGRSDEASASAFYGDSALSSFASSLDSSLFSVALGTSRSSFRPGFLTCLSTSWWGTTLLAESLAKKLNAIRYSLS